MREKGSERGARCVGAVGISQGIQICNISIYFKAEDLRPLLLGCMSYFMSDLLASIRNEMRWGQLAAKDSFSLPCSPKAKLSLRFHVPEMPQSPGSMPSRPDRIQFSVSIYRHRSELTSEAASSLLRGGKLHTATLDASDGPANTFAPLVLLYFGRG